MNRFIFARIPRQVLKPLLGKIPHLGGTLALALYSRLRGTHSTLARSPLIYASPAQLKQQQKRSGVIFEPTISKPKFKHGLHSESCCFSLLPGPSSCFILPASGNTPRSDAQHSSVATSHATIDELHLVLMPFRNSYRCQGHAFGSRR